MPPHHISLDPHDIKLSSTVHHKHSCA